MSLLPILLVYITCFPIPEADKMDPNFPPVSYFKGLPDSNDGRPHRDTAGMYKVKNRTLKKRLVPNKKTLDNKKDLGFSARSRTLPTAKLLYHL